MNSKTLVIVISLLILSFLTNLYFLTNNKNQKSANLSPTFSNVSTSSDTSSLPISPKQQNVNSAFAVYVFSGKITKVEPLSSGSYNLTLDISDNSLPKFTVTKDTLVFQNDGKNLTQVHPKSLTVGTNVAISMTYDLKSGTWSLSNITLTSGK